MRVSGLGGDAIEADAGERGGGGVSGAQGEARSSFRELFGIEFGELQRQLEVALIPAAEH